MRKSQIFKNRILLGTILGGTMLFFAAGNSKAQDGKLLNPAGNWAVSKLASSSATGQDYCAMARRFDQNVIVTFAQNAGDKSSLALDLQNNTLDRAQNYDVTLKAGSVETRQQSVRPVSQSAFVMKLGKDPVFYDAVSKSGELKVSFSGQEYSFNMKDFAKGQMELGGCLASLDGASQEVASVSGSKNTSSRITKEATGRSATYVDPGIVDSLRQENARLRNSLESERREFERRFMEEASSSRASELSEKITLLEKQNAGLQQRLASNADGEQASSTPVNGQLEDEMNSLRQENQNYQQQIMALEDKVRQMAQSASANAGPSDITARSVSQDKDVMDLKVALKQKDEEIWKLNSQLIAAGSKGAQVAARVPSAPIAAMSDSDKDQYEAQLSQKDRMIQDLNMQINMMSEQDGASNEVAQRIASLSQELQDLKDQKAGLDDSHKVALAQKNSRIASLEAQISQAAGDSDVIAAKDAQILSLKSDLDSMQAMINKIESDYQNRNAELQARVDSQLLQLQASEQERAELVRHAQSEEQQIIRELELKVTNLELENNRLSDKNDSVIDQQTAASALDSLTDFKTVEAELNSVLRERNSLAARVEAMEEAQRSERMETAKGNWDFEKATTRFGEAERQIKRLGQKLEQSRAQCTIEKKELEYKLFDPRVAAPEQTVKLITLEKELANSRTAVQSVEQRYLSQIEQLEEELRNRSKTPEAVPETEAEVASLRQQLQAAQTLMQQKDERHRAQMAALQSQKAQIQKASVSRAAAKPARVSKAPVATASNTVQARPVSLAPKPVHAQDINTPPQSYDDFASAAEFSKLLQDNGVSLSAPVRTGGDTAGKIMRYSWRSGQVDGNAEQHSITSPRQYENVMKSYIQAQKTKCRGDFAAVPVADRKSGSLRVSSYDLACVGTGRDSTSSVVFYNTEEVFTSIAHNAGLDNMDMAMDVRDRIAMNILKGRVAF